MRYFKATVEYDGTDFAGFQFQHDARTVQGVLEAAIKERTGQQLRLVGAGRTDAGVHALGQVVSFGCETRIPLEKMAIALNSALPPDLTIRHVEETAPEFSARFSASSRLYAYMILNRNVPSAIMRRYSAQYSASLDVDMMQIGANHLLGEQDFACFTNELEADKSSMRDVLRCRVNRRGKFVVVRIEASAFLRGMVRNIVGTLMEVGAGRRDANSLPDLIRSRDRRQAGPTAPPQGLCLLKARYGFRKDYAAIRAASEAAKGDTASE